MVTQAKTDWRNRNITVGVATQQQISFLRQYYQITNSGEGLVYPHLTAIVDVDNGNVRGVTWDDACVFCGGNECQNVVYNYDGILQTQGTAGQPVGGCPQTEAECLEDPNSCDLLLYVVWSGTDSDGNSFQSAASRFSMFPAQDIKDRFTRNIPNIPGTGQNNGAGNQ